MSDEAMPAAEPAPVDAPEPTKAERRAQRWAETKVDLKWATVLLLFLLMVLPIILNPVGTLRWKDAPAGEENVDGISNLLFGAPTTGAHPGDGDLVAPFEVLSVLLLAALIAGVVVALRGRETEEDL